MRKTTQQYGYHILMPFLKYGMSIGKQCPNLVEPNTELSYLLP